MKYINRQNTCPRCKSKKLVYGTLRIEDGMCYFPYTCTECGLRGEEWYLMEFSGHNIYENDELIELKKGE